MIEQVMEQIEKCTDEILGDDYDDDQDVYRKHAQAIVDLSKHAAVGLSEDECKWEVMTGFHHETRLYKTGCGAKYQGFPHKFCPYCGGEIKEKS